MLGFGGWAVFEFGRDIFGFCPLSGFAISPAVGRETLAGGPKGRAWWMVDGGWWLVVGWFSGRNHFVVGGVWLLFPP